MTSTVIVGSFPEYPCLEGAYVYMHYNPGTVTFPRAFWAGDVLFQKEQKPESTRWTYMIDAVTGELFNICYGRQLDVSVSLAYDPALEKDYHLYAELAQKKTEECKLLDSPVDRVEYNCQGYSGNDPTITVDVIGKKTKKDCNSMQKRLLVFPNKRFMISI